MNKDLTAFEKKAPVLFTFDEVELMYKVDEVFQRGVQMGLFS